MVEEAKERNLTFQGRPIQRFGNISKWYSSLSYENVFNDSAENMFAICYGIFKGDDQYAIKMKKNHGRTQSGISRRK